MNSIITGANNIQTLELHGSVKNIYSQIQSWNRNRVTRKQLHNLPDYLLNDIGVSRKQAQVESVKLFWQ